MGIKFNVTKEGENYINLTEYSIKKVIFNSDKDITLYPKINDITNGIVLEGIINFESVLEPLVPMLDDYGDQIMDENDEPMFHEREIDYVRKLANWAIIPEYLNCYGDLEYTITDSAGRLVKESSYENLFIVDYWEKYDDEQGHGKFCVLLRERENGPAAAKKSEKAQVNPAPPQPLPKDDWTPQPLRDADGNVIMLASAGGLDGLGGGINTTGIDGESYTDIRTSKGVTIMLSREKLAGAGILDGQFVNFSGTSDYGGNQRWFENEINLPDITQANRDRMADTGCGSVAATNIIYYYALTNRLFGNIVKGSLPPSMEEFINYAATMYTTYTKQTIPGLGIWFIDTIANGVVTFARRESIELRPHILTNARRNLNSKEPIISYDDAVTFLKQGLNGDNPVVLLVTYNDYIAEYEASMSQTHFVTITAMTEIVEKEITFDQNGVQTSVKDLGIKDYELTTSDYGRRKTISSLKQMWEATSPGINAVRNLGLASISFVYFTLVSAPVDDAWRI